MNVPLTIQETQTKLLAGEITVVALVDAYLARIKAFDTTINSFITLTEKEAYAAAKKADGLIKEMGKKAFTEFPLLGVCVAHKDLYLTKDIRTTAASSVLGNYIPAYSATVVDRFEKAGAILIGKTNCDAWAHGASGENSDFGITRNPWNTDRVPGGSSSGSAAALAANFSLITTGTDTGGSIRCPANFCGVYGLKPTYGSVSRYGIISMASSTDSIGHMARSVEDIETVYRVTRGVDGRDSTLVSGTYLSVKKSYTIGIPKEYFVEGVDDEVKRVVDEAIKLYEKRGATFVDVSLPNTKHAISVYYIIQPAEVSSNLGRYDGVRFGTDRDSFGDEAKRRIMLGTFTLSSGYRDAYYLKAMKVRSLIIRDFNTVFDSVDALITPVMPTPAFKVGEKTDDPLQMYLADIFTVSANLAGIPALAVPFGETKTHLPLGFQLMGPHFSENVLFDLAKQYETESGYKPRVATL